MNASSWRKAADLVAQGTQVNQQVQTAATADSSQLESFPLSALSANDSGPLQVNYGTEQPLTVSTPRANLTLTRETQADDTYRQIILGMSKRLYPTLIADGLLSTPAADNCSTLQRQITSEVDKYLQEAAEKHGRDDNYYDGSHVATNTSSPQQEANFLEEDNNPGSDEEADNANVPESNGSRHQHILRKFYRMQHPAPGQVRNHPRGRRTTNRRKTRHSQSRYCGVHTR